MFTADLPKREEFSHTEVFSQVAPVKLIHARENTFIHSFIHCDVDLGSTKYEVKLASKGKFSF